MRLLNVHSLKFTEFHEDRRPKYVIASHRWVEGNEVSLRDVLNATNTEKSGYKKIKDFAGYVLQHVPGVEWLWIDTCCIDKTSAAELSKSLNLMFEWYCNAVLCIAYLADVNSADDKSEFERSEWFKRGWTLQELLGPRLIVFVTGQWQVIGNKGASSYLECGTASGPGLEEEIAAITDIPERVLRNYAESASLSVEEKLKWMEGRATTEPEDMSYALYGIFGVTQGANYGERYERARQRLLAAVHYQDNVAAQKAERFQRIVEWLSPPDPWTNHQSARQLHEANTGSWLLQSNQYHDWKTSSTRHMWLYGKAGCGKTVLSSTAIKDMKDYCEGQPNAGMAVFYFSFSDNRKQRLADLLCSLVAQLGWKGPACLILQQAFDKPNRSTLGMDELEAILLACFEAYHEVFLLIDALDECPEESDTRHMMFECLSRLSQKAQNVKIFATSRELLDIRVATETLGAVPLAIVSQSVDVDIRQYVVSQISQDFRLSRLDQKTRTLIEDTLSERADGMFRWAFCQLQELKKLKITKPKYVKALLHDLPATLDDTYERMLGNIEGMFRADAFTLLQWLAYAESPPSLGELAEATIIDLLEDTVEVDERGRIEDTLHILSGLVTTNPHPEDYHNSEDSLSGEVYNSDDALPGENYHNDGAPAEADCKGDQGDEDKAQAHDLDNYKKRNPINKDTKVRLAHFSVKEYLESKRVLESKVHEFHLESTVGHRLLAQSCLVYLMHYSQSREKYSTPEDLTRFPLLLYAARSWFFHSSRQDRGDVSRELSLLTSKEVMHDWLLLFQPDKNWKSPFKPILEEGSSLYYASCIGLDLVVRRLLENGVDINAQGGYFKTALGVASYYGQREIVRILLDTGADVNAIAGEYGTALGTASYSGNEQVVRILLDAGVDVNAKGEYYGTALGAASYQGEEEVVRILLNAGVDVNAKGGGYGTALGAASFFGREEIVRILLNTGVDVNILGGLYGTALGAASYRGDKEVVRMLLDAGADVNAKGGDYGTALGAASYSGSEEVVRILLDAGADVNAHVPETLFGTALQQAQKAEHQGIVQMLLDAGANDAVLPEGEEEVR